MLCTKFPWQYNQKHWENKLDRHRYDILKEAKLSEQKLNDVLDILKKYNMLKED